MAGCGDGDGDSANGEGTARGAVRIADFEFAPESVTVPAGTRITWTNDDRASHTASASDGSFDTGPLDQGDSKAIAFDDPGTYAYVCQFHPFMKGTVEVTE